MKDLETIIARAEAKWQTATNEERDDLIKNLRNAEGRSSDIDDLTRTRIAGLIHRIQAARHSHDKEYVAPPLTQGNGFGFGQTLPSRFDTPDR
jgi:hypothetical protein